MAGYLGNAPTAVPLSSADITDGIITNADIANSTINLTTKVTGSLPIANGGTGLTALGTASQVLRVNSGATALEFATPSAGAMVLLATTSASNVSSFAVNGYFTSDYDVYKLFLINISGGQYDVRVRINTTGSYTPQTSNGDYHYTFTRLDGNESNATSREDASQYNVQNSLMMGRMFDTSGERSNSEITIYNPTNTDKRKILTSVFGGYSNASGNLSTGTSAGVYRQNTAITGLTILAQIGNITVDKVQLFGIKNT